MKLFSTMESRTVNKVTIRSRTYPSFVFHGDPLELSLSTEHVYAQAGPEPVASPVNGIDDGQQRGRSRENFRHLPQKIPGENILVNMMSNEVSVSVAENHVVWPDDGLGRFVDVLKALGCRFEHWREDLAPVITKSGVRMRDKLKRNA